MGESGLPKKTVSKVSILKLLVIFLFLESILAPSLAFVPAHSVATCACQRQLQNN